MSMTVIKAPGCSVPPGFTERNNNFVPDQFYLSQDLSMMNIPQLLQDIGDLSLDTNIKQKPSMDQKKQVEIIDVHQSVVTESILWTKSGLDFLIKVLLILRTHTHWTDKINWNKNS